jgi:hypothetical protein
MNVLLAGVVQTGGGCRMKRNILILMFASAALFAGDTPAANWFALQNNEPPGARPYTFWGFIQPQYVHNQGGTVQGMAAPAQVQGYNGQPAVFNLVGPDADHSSEFQLLRARAGVRGVVPGSDNAVNYFVLTEFGNNGLTREKRAVFTDLSLNFNYIPGARIRAGLGRLPLGEEALQGIQVLDYINFTNATDNLLNERFVTPYATTRPTAPVLGVPMGVSQIAGPVSGFQDTGIEVYDWFVRDRWELSYAAMFSNGNGINFAGSNGKIDSTLHLRVARIFDGTGPRREEVMAYVWHQDGTRTFSGSDYRRMREGVGFRYFENPWRISGEYLRGKGMIFVGPSPPFNDVGNGAFEPVTLMALEGSNKANGHYLDIGWRLSPQWEADVRYDRLNRLTNSAFDERIFTTWTLGAQFFYSPKLRLTANYEIRSLKVAYPGAAGTSGSAQAQQIQLTNARIIGDSMGNRLSVQLTYIF